MEQQHEEQEHEVYGGEIPDEGEMETDLEMSARAEEEELQDASSKVPFPAINLSLSLSPGLFAITFLLVAGLGGHEEEAQGDRRRSRRSSRNAGQGRERDGCCSRSFSLSLRHIFLYINKNIVISQSYIWFLLSALCSGWLSRKGA